MAFPKLLQKLFANSGAGPLLRSDILPIDSALSDSSTNPVQNKIIKAAIDSKTFPVDSALSSTSTNAVQNKVINNALGLKANTSALAAVATSGSYSDLSNRPTIPTSGSVVTLVSSSYDSTTGSWYRKWSDGYIEQGGNVSLSDAQFTKASVTLPLAMSNTNYIVLVSGVPKSVTSETTVGVLSYQKTSSTTITVLSSGPWSGWRNAYFSWMVRGK